MSLADPDTQLIYESPVPAAYRAIPAAVAKWIDAVVPCIARGPQSKKVTDAVLARLRREHVSDQVIRAAIALSIYKFDHVLVMSVDLPVDVHPNDRPAPPSMGPNPDDELTSVRRAAQGLEQQYRAAMASHNLVLLRAIAKALFDLLVGSGTPNEDMRKDKEKMDERREEIERNAPTASRSIRRLNGPPPNPGRGRVRQVGPHEYIEIEDDVIEVDAGEGGEGDGDGDGE